MSREDVENLELLQLRIDNLKAMLPRAPELLHDKLSLLAIIARQATIMLTLLEQLEQATGASRHDQIEDVRRLIRDLRTSIGECEQALADMPGEP